MKEDFLKELRFKQALSVVQILDREGNGNPGWREQLVQMLGS